MRSIKVESTVIDKIYTGKKSKFKIFRNNNFAVR